MNMTNKMVAYFDNFFFLWVLTKIPKKAMNALLLVHILTSAPIGAWEVKLEIMSDTDRPTDVVDPISRHISKNLRFHPQSCPNPSKCTFTSISEINYLYIPN